jgi:hypothetical protein
MVIALPVAGLALPAALSVGASIGASVMSGSTVLESSTCHTSTTSGLWQDQASTTAQCPASVQLPLEDHDLVPERENLNVRGTVIHR